MLLGGRIGTGVGEEKVVDRLVREFVLLLDVEVLGLALPVMCADEAGDDVGQIIFVGQFQSFSDVADNHLCALHVGQSVVRVVA